MGTATQSTELSKQAEAKTLTIERIEVIPLRVPLAKVRARPTMMFPFQ